MGSDRRDRGSERKRSRSRDRGGDRRDQKRDRRDERRDRGGGGGGGSSSRDSRRDDRDGGRDRGRSDKRRESPIRRKSPTPPSLIPRAKTPPKGGTGGFFVRGGVQKSTMKKSDNVDDHVFMPGEKISEAFMTERAEPKEEKPVQDKDKADDIEGANLDIRNAKRAANADDYQVRMLSAAHKFNQTEKSMEVKMTAARIQNGYKPGGGIRANEIKGFLNIWCNQRRLKPEYEFIERGKPPKGTFICKLKIDGFPYVADCEARTKREAQADAAWDFANKLVELGYCNKTDLPNKTMATVNNQGCVPTEWKSVLNDDMISAGGHWTPDNCRKRLSMFCNYERISCEILNTALGPDHAKIAISELKLTLRKYGKEFYAKEQARTKKLANSLVAWSIMKQLYQADMIEAFGERMKKAADSKFLNKGGIEPGQEVGNDIQQDGSMDMTTGDWTLDSSRTRLHEFFLERGIEVEYGMLEIGFPPDRVYQAEMQFEIEGKRYYSFYECDNKKMTQKKTAFDIVVKLYKDKKVEPNTGRRNWGDGPSGNVLGGAMFPPPTQYLNPNCTPRERDEFFCKTKLDMITPHPNHVNVVNSTLTMIEGCLKQISDEMFEAARQLPGRDQLPDKENRELMGVMRVGALAASTVLNGECEFMMVMMMKEKPTYQVLNNIAKRLDQRVPHEEQYNFNVKPNYQEGGIEIWRERRPEMMILIKMTSQRWGAQVEDDPMLTVAQKMEIKLKEEAEANAKHEANGEVKQEPTIEKVEKQEESDKDETKEDDKEEEKADEKAEVKQEHVEQAENTEDTTETTEPSTEPAEVEETPKEDEKDGDEAELEKVAAIEAEMETKSAPSTSTLKLGTEKEEEEEDDEEGEIKMIDPADENGAANVETEPESEKSDFERKIEVDPTTEAASAVTEPTVEPVATPLSYQPDKLLGESGCTLALAELRHSKWFAEQGQQVVSVVPLIRILREMCQRVRTLGVLSDYQINVLCHKSLESGRMPLLPSDGIRRVLSTLAGGILLDGGLGVADPCEKARTDCFASLSTQDREDLTASAQHALRLLSFGVMHKILGIQPPQ